MPREWANASPAAMLRMRAILRGNGTASLAWSRSKRLRPASSSMTMYARPASSRKS